jgi:serine/threonine-protein kinase
MLLTRIARGGMADVYLAEPSDQQGSGKFRAIKCLLPRLAQRRKFVNMFKAEGRLGLLLKHPNIVRTFQVGNHNRIHYISMEFIEGHDLGRVIRFFRRVEAPVPVDITVSVVRDVLTALAYTHTLNDEKGHPLDLINRDISPANIMLGYDGSIRVIDFGIAQALLDYRSQIGSIKGKIMYMSPEQVRGLALDARSDLFSLGTVMYQLLTMREPFRAPTEFEQMERVREANPLPVTEINRRIDPELSGIVAKAMAKDPNLRFQTAEAMFGELDAYAQRAQVGLDPAVVADFLKSEFGDERARFIGSIETAREFLHEVPLEIFEDRDPTAPTLKSKVEAAEKAVAEEERTAQVPAAEPTGGNPKWLLPAVIILVFLAGCLLTLAILTKG